MTIADQLISISNTKSAIKSAIEAKGVTVGSVAFDEYPNKIAAITGSGSTPEPIPDWVRPSDWLPMPSFSTGEQKIVGLFPVFNHQSNAVSFTVQGAYTVDWGDGTVENYVAGGLASHNYVYSGISDSTITSKGYKQVLVTITPQAGFDITQVKFDTGITNGPNMSGGLYIYQNWLDLIISVPKLSTQSNITLGTSAIRWPYCERVWLKETPVVGINCPYLFALFYSLQSVPAFKLSPATNCTAMFYNCGSLRKLEGFDFTPAGVSTGTLSNMFYGCVNLESVSDTFAGAAITGDKMQFMFNGCNKLREVPSSLAGASPTNLTSTFNSCYLIDSIPAINFSGVTSMSQTFYNCYKLKEISETSFPALLNAGSAFYNCKSLTSVTANLPVCTSTASMFYGCDSMREATITTSTALTNAGSMFNGCKSLIKVGVFNTGSVTNAGSMFSACEALNEIPEFNFGAVTSFSNIFSGGGASAVSRIKATGISQTISVAGMLLGANALNEIYTNLPTVTGKTITITNNWGKTGDDPTIASSKGWSVVGS